MIDVPQLDAGGGQTKVDGMEGQLVRAEGNRPLTVFDACKSLLFRCGQHPAILDQAGSGIMKGRINAERVQVELLLLWLTV